MIKKIASLVVSGALVVLPYRAPADDDEEYSAGVITAAADAQTATPSAPAPTEVPPPPPAAQPAPPVQAQPYAAQPTGQWVYTDQYGWVWMPYGSQYSYVPSDGYGEPYLYVYYPVYGWCWVSAPWVWGFGPWPFFGFIGPRHFGWFAAGFWRQPWRWHFAPARGTGFGGFRSGAVRPFGGRVVRAPFRTEGSGFREAGPGFRGGGSERRGMEPRGGGAMRGGGGMGRGGGGHFRGR